MKLIIVRHGQTEENVSKILQGHNHGTLTKNGREQIEKLAGRLKDYDIDYIFSSDLGRTRETAKEIAKYHDVPLEFTRELREKDTGVFTGKHHSELVRDREKKNLPKHRHRPEGGESYMDARERASNFLKKLKESYLDDTVLLVSHGALIRMFISLILDKDPEEAVNMKQRNTAVNAFEITDSGGKEIALNDVSHLEDL